MYVFGADTPADLPTPTWRTRAVAYALAHEQGWIALVREKDGRYDLPGGGVEDGESVLATLIREVEEEAGLHIVPTRLVAQAGDLKWTDGVQVLRYGPCWLADVVGVTEPSEIKYELVWVRAAEAPDMLHRPSHKHYAKQWLAMSGAHH